MNAHAPAIRLYDHLPYADLFAGGGGASTGAHKATGRSPLIAINHDKYALACHEQNHPETVHLRGDVFHYNPDNVAAGRRFGFAWFSPDCTYFSKAKGSAPFTNKQRARRIRGLAWVMCRWAESSAKPYILFMENVEEIQGWGPLLETEPGSGKYVPDPDRRGYHWRRFDEATGQSLTAPMDTITTRDSKALVTTTLIRRDSLADEHVDSAVRCAAFLVKFFGTGVARDLRDPAGTLTTKDRLGLIEVVLVKVGESEYVLVDIGMRMLTPRELFNLQGFPKSYIIDRGVVDGRMVSFPKGTQTRLVGNSVPPDLAAAVIAANLNPALLECVA